MILGANLGRGIPKTFEANTSAPIYGYGLYIAKEIASTGGTILFTFGYHANSVHIISDPFNLSSSFTITKSETGQSASITCTKKFTISSVI